MRIYYNTAIISLVIGGAVLLLVLSQSLGIPIWIGPLFALLFVAALLEPRIVQQDQRWAMEIFGAYSRTLTPGLNFTIRGLEKIAREGRNRRKGIRSTREFVRDIDIGGTITQDGVKIEDIQTKLRTRLKTFSEDKSTEDPSDPNYRRGPVFKNTYALSGGIDVALRGLTEGVVRAVVGSHELKYLLNNINAVEMEIEQGMNPTLSRYGEKFVQLDIMEIIPPEEIRTLLERPLIELKEGEAAVNKATAEGKAAEAKARGDAEAAALRAQGEANATRIAADAAKAAAIARATGIKEALELEANAKAETMRTMMEVYKSGGSTDPITDATNYMLAEEQLEAFSKLASNGGLVVIPNDMKEIGSLFAMVKKGLASPPVPTADPPKAPTQTAP